MKKIVSLIIIVFLSAAISNAQNDEKSDVPADSGLTAYPVKGDTTKIRVGTKELHIVDADKFTSIEVIDLQTNQRDTAYVYEGVKKSPKAPEKNNLAVDTTKIRVGKKEFHIIESGGNTMVQVINLRTQNMDTTIVFKDNVVTVPDIEKAIEEEIEAKAEWHKELKKKYSTEGHYAGVEFGWNNYLDANRSLSLFGADEFMDLNTGRSLAFNINVFDYRIPIIHQYVGLVTGLGLELNNYSFNNNNSIYRYNGYIEEKPNPAGTDYKKTKLATGYITIPLLIEFQFPSQDENAFFVSAGVFGSVKTWSYTKEVYMVNDNQIVNRTHDDFYLSPFRYGLMARAGYGSFSIFAKYSMVSFFEKNRGPELYPFTIGIALTN